MGKKFNNATYSFDKKMESGTCWDTRHFFFTVLVVSRTSVSQDRIKPRTSDWRCDFTSYINPKNTGFNSRSTKTTTTTFLFHIQVLFPGSAQILSAERSFTQLISGFETLDLRPINNWRYTARCLETAFLHSYMFQYFACILILI